MIQIIRKENLREIKEDRGVCLKKGQVLIESLLGMGVFLTFFWYLFFLFYIFISHIFIHHYLDQSLFCMAQGSSIEFCEKQMVQKTRQFVVWGSFEKFTLVKRRKIWKGSLTWKMGKKISFQFQRSLTLPKDLFN